MQGDFETREFLKIGKEFISQPLQKRQDLFKIFDDLIKIQDEALVDQGARKD